MCRDYPGIKEYFNFTHVSLTVVGVRRKEIVLKNVLFGIKRQYKQCKLMRLLCYCSLTKQLLVNVTDNLSSAIRKNIKPCPENCSKDKKGHGATKTLGLSASAKVFAESI